MGIDYLACANKNCGKVFPDVVDFVYCECGKVWCSDECAEEDGYIAEHCKEGCDIEDNECDISCWSCDGFVESTCKYCRSEDFDDKELLEFLLRASNMNREELIEQFKKHQIKHTEVE